MARRMLPLLLVLALCLPPRAARAAEWTMPEDVDAAALTDGTGGVLLCGSGEEQARQVAGLARLPALLTLARAFDAGALDGAAALRVSERAAGIGGPTAFLESGEQMAADELMKAAVMISAGDAIVTLGEGAFGSEAAFVEAVNDTLAGLGIGRTVTDALGTGLALSARELAVLGAAAAQSGTFLRYSALYYERLAHADGRQTDLVSANQLVRSYAGCVGLLTGSSAEDGYCGVFAAVRSSTAFIAVVIGADDPAARTAAASALLDYGFASYRVETLLRAGDAVVEDAPVQDGAARTVDLVVRGDVSLLLPRADAAPQAAAEAPQPLCAPLSADTAVGTVRFFDAAGALVAEAPLYPAADVPAFALTDILRAIVRSFFGLPAGL